MEQSTQVRAAFGLFGVGILGLLGLIAFWLPRYTESSVPVLFDLLGVETVFGVDVAAIALPMLLVSFAVAAVSFVAGGKLLNRAYAEE